MVVYLITNHSQIENAVSEFKDKVDTLTRDPRENADKKEEAEQEHLHDKVCFRPR